jgi:hypothetical protein
VCTCHSTAELLSLEGWHVINLAAFLWFESILGWTDLYIHSVERRYAHPMRILRCQYTLHSRCLETWFLS